MLSPIIKTIFCHFGNRRYECLDYLAPTYVLKDRMAQKSGLANSRRWQKMTLDNKLRVIIHQTISLESIKAILYVYLSDSIRLHKII